LGSILPECTNLLHKLAYLLEYVSLKEQALGKKPTILLSMKDHFHSHIEFIIMLVCVYFFASLQSVLNLAIWNPSHSSVSKVFLKGSFFSEYGSLK